MKAFINNTAIVSPQRTFDQDFPSGGYPVSGCEISKMH